MTGFLSRGHGSRQAKRSAWGSKGTLRSLRHIGSAWKYIGMPLYYFFMQLRRANAQAPATV